MNIMRNHFLDENELIWKRRGRLYRGSIIRFKGYIVSTMVCILMAVLHKEIRMIYRESADAYKFLGNVIINTLNGSNYATANYTKIVVNGLNKLNKSDIESMLTNAEIVNMNVKEIKNILSECPFITSLHVRRNIATGAFIVDVKERNFIASIPQENGKIIAIDENGKLINMQESEYGVSSLIKIQNSKNIDSFISLYNYLKYLKIQDKVKEINMISGRRWDIQFKNNLLVKLPAINWHKALDVLIYMNKKIGVLSNINKMIYVDLRVENKIFLR